MGRKSKYKQPNAHPSFGVTSHNTERTGVAILMHWMREIIEQKNIDLGLPNVETSGDDRKMPDAVIYESRRSQKVLCLIEAKQPFHDVFDEQELKEPARSKATRRHAKYFALTNFKKLIWYDTEKVNALKSEEEQIKGKYSLSEIDDLDDIEQSRYKESIKRNLEDFLTKLYSVHTGKEPEPKQAVDDLLIFRLHEKIRVLATYYKRIIDERCHQDHSFATKLTTWFSDQGWSFAWQPVDFEKAARQTAYLITNKILFYDLLQAKRPQELDPLDISESLTKGYRLQTTLQGYFDEALKIDYETIFRPDFLDAIAFPDAKEIVREIKELIRILRLYDFSKLGYDVIGRIFERLIPQNERHQLGQYFTNPDVVDLTLRFCLQHEDDKVLDPSCGAGTFLVRAYQHKKLMNDRKRHEEILETLWGNDIAKFPAHLAAINLAINDLGVDKNYPNILQEDFFALPIEADGFKLPERYRKRLVAGLGQEKREITYPHLFNAIVGNPPYTRQEEISHIAPENALYKRKLIDRALQDTRGKKVADISERAGIHAYFFVYGTQFLKEGGYFGFVVADSWLDTEYGIGIQEFLLNNYKILAIIGSKVERWFEEADVNTCIVILQKCNVEKERQQNLVRFVSLKRPLRHFIPPALDIWEKQIERLSEIDRLKRTIIAHNNFYENEELVIHPVLQQELWEEGFDVSKKKYVGTKWGKYLRAPLVFFRILKENKDKLVPLKQMAEVRFGLKTGANEFFHLKDEDIKRLGIESRYLEPILFSLKEVKGYKLDKKALANCVIICNDEKQDLEGTNLLKYIEQGEEKGYDKRPTCAQRSPAPWYSLAKGWDYAPLIFPAKVGERMPVFLNDGVFEDKKLYGITPKDSIGPLLLGALLNSTLSRLFIEFTCRQLTGSQAIADIDVAVVESLPIIDINKLNAQTKTKLIAKFKKLAKTDATSLFKEIAPSPQEVSLERIKPELRELDKIVMEDILGLSEAKQVEIYTSLVDFVRARLKKAKSFGAKTKNKEGVDVDALTKLIIGRITDESKEAKTLSEFYKEKVSLRTDLIIKALPERHNDTRVEKDLFGWMLYSGSDFIDCRSEDEARYLRVFLDVGLKEVKIPKDDEYLAGITPELETLKRKIDAVINSYLDSILDRRIREKVKRGVFMSIAM